MARIIRLLLLLATTWLGAASSAAREPTLRFIASPDIDTRLTVAQIQEKVAAVEVRMFDPQHGKQKHYRGFPLAALLTEVFGKEWQHDTWTEMVFTALDGYASVSTLEKLAEPGGILVFDDLDVSGWEPIGDRDADPRPFYLTWTGNEQTTQHQYPWPWQLVRVELIRFEDRYPAIYPGKVDPHGNVYLGFLTFKGRCMRCHAINRQGGVVGPDLNAPQSVTEYRSPAWLKAYIHEPSRFRYTHMPDHSDLDDVQITQVIEYLRHVARRPEEVTK